MTNLQIIRSPSIERLLGYLEAAQCIVTRGVIDLTLHVFCFEIKSMDVTDEDIIKAAYPDGYNPIDNIVECSINDFITDIEVAIRLPRDFWNPAFPGAIKKIEENLRKGFWKHFNVCFDYNNARIVSIGNHVPFVNIGGGFTYILYTPDKDKCLLFVCNFSD